MALNIAFSSFAFLPLCHTNRVAIPCHFLAVCYAFSLNSYLTFTQVCGAGPGVTPHFIDEETEIQRADTICLRSEWVCKEPVQYWLFLSPPLHYTFIGPLSLPSSHNSFVPIAAHVFIEQFYLLSTIGHSLERWPKNECILSFPQNCLSFITKLLVFLCDAPRASLGHTASAFSHSLLSLAPWTQAVIVSPRWFILKPSCSYPFLLPFYVLSSKLGPLFEHYALDLLQKFLISSLLAPSLSSVVFQYLSAPVKCCSAKLGENILCIVKV